MDCKDPVICHKRNIHNRTLDDINKVNVIDISYLALNLIIPVIKI